MRRTRSKVSIFKKIAGALNTNFFCKNFQNPSLYIKEQSPKIKFEIKSLIFFKIPKNGQNSFLSKKKEKERKEATYCKDMKFWNWGPTIIWHNLGCVAFYFSKSLHPTVGVTTK